MTNIQQFRLPDVGEGLVEAEVVRWHVHVGQSVEVNDVLVDIETAKSVVELPSPWAGVVHELFAEEGSVVEVGTPIVAVAVAVATETAPEPNAPSSEGTDRPAAARGPLPAEDAGADQDKPQVLVGPGPKPAVDRRRRLTAPAMATQLDARAAAASGAATTSEASHPPGRTEPPPVLCKPPVRKLAKQLGVDLLALAGTVSGPVTRADIEGAAAAAGRKGAPDTPSKAASGQHMRTAAPQAPAGPDARETRIPIKGVRKAIAQAMTKSAFSAPHVTEWLAVDMTPTMELVRRLKSDPKWSGVRINPLLFVARAFIIAVRNFPDINASWDADANEIVVKDYVNLGVAAATPRGLIVPNIKDAHLMDLRQLAAAFDDLVATARAGKTQPADMAHGTVTLTNIGALGVDSGTPILNPGESAILAFGQVRRQPWVFNDQLAIREITQLAMSFDHRLVDGELGSRVLARTGEVLADPSAALLYT